MHVDQNEPVIIELDDPAPRGAGFIGVIVVIAVVAIITAPFVISTHIKSDTSGDIPAQTHTQSSSDVCQPRFDVPDFFDPITHFALPGFMRLCDWFVPPAPPASQLTPNDRDVIQPSKDSAFAAGPFRWFT